MWERELGELVSLAGNQRGLVTPGQAAKLGVSVEGLDHLTETQLIRRLPNGMYYLKHTDILGRRTNSRTAIGLPWNRTRPCTNATRTSVLVDMRELLRYMTPLANRVQYPFPVHGRSFIEYFMPLPHLGSLSPATSGRAP
ncbi:type IV toxin-antitoxin system AbiEi family antitoxin domain-containing protein [Actinokineospora auranticolor]|uniref:Uncharacterized protein n=1 Tax=Actinokineospora auranticolor TaxID=155976 RepID=A0A2S6GJ98_9PSEU|nr:type IV toxin-antitoxin system AbiEi family antitoxin domain-containing protein [Actinokineospora auranticolor]PPK65263.1 hypothetical protein CLV40_115110 [Actinokineospora auranticolor]